VDGLSDNVHPRGLVGKVLAFFCLSSRIRFGCGKFLGICLFPERRRFLF
jgi:hypothetical protein